MRPVIPMLSYVDPGVFEREIRAMRDAWHFVGLRRDVPEPDDWILARVADQDVVVQNFDGELRAFTNTCSHRFNAIRSGACGRGALTCPYHRWTFDRDGTPVGIPFRNGFTDLDPSSLRLERWDVALSGNVIFVRPWGVDGPGLPEWLGSLGDWLSTAAAGLGREYARYPVEVEANWKLVVQNTLEFDHVYSVHPETFGALVASKPSLVALDLPPPHVGYHAPMLRKAPERAIERRILEIFRRSVLGQSDDHEHVTIFPMGSFGVFRGESISVLRFIPRSATHTTIDTRLFLPTIDALSDVEGALLDAYTPSMTDFARKLGDEDRDVCETVQRGVANLTGHRGILGAGEVLVAAFQQAYVDFMRSRGVVLGEPGR